MAAEGDTREEMQFHARSYSAFAWMMKWGAILSFITAMVVILIIAS